MNEIVSDKLAALKPYNPDINVCDIHLDANESFIELPLTLKNSIAEKIASVHYNRYPDPLASRVCEAFGRRYGISGRYITAGNGSDELITVILNSFVQKGERVLITEPDFSMYRFYCSIAEILPVIIGKRGDLNFSIDEMILIANSEKVRLIIFSNPCNPTGQGISAEDALKIINETNCIVVIDEAYMDFWDQSLIKFAPLCEKLIVLKTCSKVGFAAARLGFAISNAQFTDYLRAAKSPYNVNTLTQAAGEALLEEGSCLDEAIEKIIVSRNELYESLKLIEKQNPYCMCVFETHTNFVTVGVKSAKTVHASLKAAGISVRLLFDRYLRITAGTHAENISLCAALERALI
jgi:histidinol-phosphate aminotransferase